MKNRETDQDWRDERQKRIKRERFKGVVRKRKRERDGRELEER